MRILEVTEYQPDWRIRYENESSILRETFGSNLSDIQHIGSTSVPGLKAKPTIDVLITVSELDGVDEINKKMENIGYTAHGEYGIPGRRFFSKIEYANAEDWVSTFHVHVFQKDDSYNINRHISIRDFLRAHPERASEYGALKAELARKFPHDGKGYTDAKSGYVRKLEEDALDWSGKSNK